MPSPFPGMDPYLESHWGDVHSSLVLYARDMLRQRLPGDLYARVEERVFVESDEDIIGNRYLDVRVVEHPQPSRSGVPFESESGGVATLTATEPLMVELPDDRVTERFVEIRDAGSGHRVVTVIEVLSHANKQSGEGRNTYLRKQNELRDSGVSLVEFDLLRTGRPTLPVPVKALPPDRRTPYRVCVWRPSKPHRVEVYPTPLRQRLPVVSVPLRETDADVPLDLQALIELTYDNGIYSLTTDYSQPPDPPLSDDDAQWATALLKRSETA